MEDDEKEYEHNPQYSVGDIVQVINPEDDDILECARGYPEEIEHLTLLSVEVCKVFDRDNFLEAVEEILEVCKHLTDDDDRWRYMGASIRIAGFATRILEHDFKQYKAKIGEEIYFLHWCPTWNCFTSSFKALR